MILRIEAQMAIATDMPLNPLTHLREDFVSSSSAFNKLTN
jgi:hypothetical protein